MSPIARAIWIRGGLPSIAIAAFGYWLAQKLTAIHGLQIFKVLNIVGLAFDFAGIVFLSHFVLRSQRLRDLSIGPIAEYTSLFLGTLPLGMFVFVLFGPTGPSRDVVESIVYGRFVFILAILIAAPFLFARVVTKGDQLLVQSPVDRLNYLGAYFLVCGIIFQFIAAVQDLYS
jgi:hypothetical protein